MVVHIPKKYDLDTRVESSLGFTTLSNYNFLPFWY